MQTPPAKTPSNPPKPSSNGRFATTAFFVCLCVGLPLAILYFLFIGSISRAKTSEGMAGMKSTASSILMYSLDHNGYFPPAESWIDAAEPYSKSKGTFRSTNLNNSSPDAYGIAFRTDLGAKQMSNAPDLNRWAMVFDSSLLQRNAHSGLETLPTPGRYKGEDGPSNIVAFADGSVFPIADSKRKELDADGKPRIR